MRTVKIAFEGRTGHGKSVLSRFVKGALCELGIDVEAEPYCGDGLIVVFEDLEKLLRVNQAGTRLELLRQQREAAE